MRKASTTPLEMPRPNYIFWVYNTLIVISILFLMYNFFFKNDKIAYVDSAKILNDYKASADAKKTYQSKANIWQANIDSLTSEIRTAIKKYEKSIATMSKKEQDLSKQLIQAKQKQSADYQRAIQQKAKEEDAKLTQGLVSQVNAFLIKYGKAHNYKMILIANQSGTIAYAREGLDITPDVVAGLNEEYSANK